ncbi:hypothetical protein SO802_015804 [Lithocarpus litseifolius]|uniref:GRF-type domain-containing protein n=1 Tax=Lithocarpus litseifolius TaxID=425828 RepID=A0AAW2CWT9_9ROSI
MEASSSTNSSLRRRAPFRCYCAKKPVLVVSWTANNPGRRFYGCPNYWVGQKCKFFQWRDDEICERGKVLIPEQRQRIIGLEVEVARCYKREKFYIVALAFLLVICGICLFNSGPTRLVWCTWNGSTMHAGLRWCTWPEAGLAGLVWRTWSGSAMHARLRWCTWPEAGHAGLVWCTWSGWAMHAGLR